MRKSDADHGRIPRVGEDNKNRAQKVVSEEFEEKYEEFENKIWRNISIHSVIPSFTMNESINK